MNKTIQGLKMEMQWYARGSYPDFVTSSRPTELGSKQVPVFMFHSITRDVFEAQLEYLADNGYGALTADELYGYIAGTGRTAGNNVVLSFDDGEESLYTIGLPLLKKFKMKAVAFICAGRMRENATTVPDMPRQWLTWKQVGELHASGNVDIQSHTYDHERMFCGSEVTGIYDGSNMGNDLGTDVPTVKTSAVIERLSLVGAPLYEMASRMSVGKRYLDDEMLRNACAKFAIEIGDSSFLRTGRGIDIIKKYVHEYRSRLGDKGTFESEAEQQKAIYDNLLKSRSVIEAKIDKKVEHLAYPWGYAGTVAVEQSKLAGFKSNWWGVLDDIRINMVDSDPFRIPRLKDDYIFRLPGRGRHSLVSVFGQKIIRRFRKSDIY